MIDFDVLRAAMNRGESGAAEIFAQIQDGRALYDHSERAWYRWNGQYWQLDRTAQINLIISRTVSSEFLRLAADEWRAGDKDLGDRAAKWAKQLCQLRTVENVLTLAQSDRRLARTGDEWDSDPFILGTPSGAIDLHTGQLIDAQRTKAAHLRNVTACEWRGLSEPAPLWEQFLADIFDNDTKIINFFQRLLGYGITGLSTERVFPMLIGDGANGKSTAVEVVSDLLGPDLTWRISARTLANSDRKNGEAPTPFLHGLRGKRLVWTSESDEGAKLDTGLVKWATGNDTLTARTLFGKPVTFRPSHLLIMSSNHRPDLPDDDQAIWDRVLLIPFNQRFVTDPQANERKRDPQIREKLTAEAPGILAWLVRGCLDWQKSGLNPPDTVWAATASYRDDLDPLAEFLTTCCDVGPQYSEVASALYREYELNERVANRQPITSTAFGRRLAKRFTKATAGVVIYKGLRVKP